ncbi:MAG TPA: DUF998 domain-containing protein [Solirubrobacteraceae bacterium]
MRDLGRRTGPVLWLVSAQYFAVQVVVAGDWADGYSWSANLISDLGNTACRRYDGRPVCSPLHVLMNASFVVLGLTMLAGAILISRALAGDRTSRAAFACLGVAGVGTVVVGLFPENAIAGLHQAGAALPFVLGNLGVLLLGISPTDLPDPVRRLTLLGGVVGLVGLVLFVSHTHVGLGAGGIERVAAYPQDVWMIGFAGYLLVRAPRAGIDARLGAGR